MHRPTTLDHQPAHAALVQVLAHGPHAHGAAAVDDGGDRAEPVAGQVDGLGRAVDELRAVAGREEVGRRVGTPSSSRSPSAASSGARRQPGLSTPLAARTSNRGLSFRTVAAFCNIWVIYGFLLGLLAVATYQNHTDVEKAVSSEASSLAARIGM